MVNQNTKEQVQAHNITYVTKEDIEQWENRAKHRMAGVCSILYFHPVPSEMYMTESMQHENQNIHAQKGTSKLLRPYLVYTDRTLFIRKWHKAKLVATLVAIQQLIDKYGIFEITSDQLTENENEEIKIWINKDPLVTALDRPKSEMVMLKQIASIIVKSNHYNSEILENLIGAQSIQEAINRFTKT